MRRTRGWKVRTPSLHFLYRCLLRAFGPQGWWPADSPFEMMVGAILTQATSWHNAERAIERLKREGALAPRRVLAMPRARLERTIRPAGYFRQKARRLRALTSWYIKRYAGSARRMFRTSCQLLRDELLDLHGIGPETADSILLYAGNQPVFVVDAYTTRVLNRHRLIRRASRYEQVQAFAVRELPMSPKVYNECHALLVAVGKRYCHRRKPDCQRCPLRDLPHTVEVC